MTNKKTNTRVRWNAPVRRACSLPARVTVRRTGNSPPNAVRKVFDLTPEGIITTLDLLRPIYAKSAAYGHFGRDDPDFTWEKTDKKEALGPDQENKSNKKRTIVQRSNSGMGSNRR